MLQKAREHITDSAPIYALDGIKQMQRNSIHTPSIIFTLTMTKEREQFKSLNFSHLSMNCSHPINTYFLFRHWRTVAGWGQGLVCFILF